MLQWLAQHAYVRSDAQTLCWLMRLAPFTLVLCPFRLLLEFTMTSSRDVLFNLSVEKLPKPLASAMVKNGFMNPLGC